MPACFAGWGSIEEEEEEEGCAFIDLVSKDSVAFQDW
jgi:hypothetical protein